MDPPVPHVLQNLRCLDQSSPDYESQLDGILSEGGFMDSVLDLKGNDLTWVVDYLDKALDTLKCSSSAMRRCLRTLRKICATGETLPSSLIGIPEFNPTSSGGFADVWKRAVDARPVCVRRVGADKKYSLQNSLKSFCKEAALWKHLNHPNILPFWGVTIDLPQLVLDWKSGGDLREYIGMHPHVDRIGLVSDVASGLLYLHSCGVIHGDLKGENILVNGAGRACIAGFGFATVIPDVESRVDPSEHRGHSIRWCAPEILNNEKPNRETDIFSFGMVMIEVFTGEIPFKGESEYTVITFSLQSKHPPRPAHPTLTDPLWELMLRCWASDPCSRPKASEVVQVIRAPGPSEQLDLLNRFSRNSLLDSQEDGEYVPNFQGADLMWLVDHLDEVANDPGSSSTISQRSLSKLRAICSATAVLPTSYIVPADALQMSPEQFDPEVRGDVYRASLGGSGVRVKRIVVLDPNALPSAERAFCEAAVTWKRLEHPNIVPILGFTISPLQLVSVQMPNGDIRGYVSRNPRTNIVGLLSDVMKGLCYLHSFNIVHMGLKGSNILVDATDHARICDFGLPAVTTHDSSVTRSHQPEYNPQWSAPEVLNEGSYSKAADIFSFGMLMAEIFNGTEPFRGLSGFDVQLAIIKGTRPPRPRHHAVTGRLWKLMQCCWDHAPQLRPEAPEVLRVLLVPRYPQVCLLQ